MEYKEFSNLLQTNLPLNRKERFYTATVLPSLLFHNGFSNLFLFLKELKGFPSDINEENTKDNFLFYTEYSLRESAGEKSIGLEILTASGDIPDVIIEICKPKKVFIVIESKVFANLNQSDLNKQMESQRSGVIDVIKEYFKLGDNQCSISH